MKKLLAIAVMFLGLSIHSNAQTPSAKTDARKEAKKNWKHELNLSKEQSEELKSVNQNFKDKSRSIKDNSTLSKEQKKEQLVNLNKEKKEKMNSILTPEQQQKMSKLKRNGHDKKDRKKDQTRR